MASLFDQYEQQASGGASRTTSQPRNPIAPVNPVANLISSEPDTPIFARMKIEYKPEQPLTHMVASNNILVMAMMNKTLTVVDLKNPNQPETIPLGTQLTGNTSQYKIFRMFLDPLGNHLIVSMLQGETSPLNFYVYLGSTGKRTYHKFARGHLVSAVAFDSLNQQNVATGPILLGTSKGVILEAEFNAPSENDWAPFGGKQSCEKYCKQIYQLQDVVLITGLHLETIASTTAGRSQKVIFLTTPRFIYRFYGQATQPIEQNSPIYEKLFVSSASWAYNNSREIPNPATNSILRVHVPKGQLVPTHFAQLFGPVGVYHADLSRLETADGPWLNFSKEPALMEFTPNQTELSASQQPVAMTLSNYHILVLFADKLKVFCQLDHSMVMEDPFPQKRMLGLSRDPVQGITWAFSESTVYRYKADREDRRLWKVLLNAKRFEEAKLFCRGDQLKLNKIRICQAKDLFTQGCYEESAKLYSETWSPFEEVSLRFLEVDQDSALRILLKQKLIKIENDQTQKPQLTMIVTWLLQLYLNRIGHLKHQLTKESASQDIRVEFAVIENDFRRMMERPSVKKIISENMKPFYKLIANHGDEILLLEFCKIMEDFGEVVQQHIQHKRYQEALDVLSSQRSELLFYRFSPELMAHLPEELVDLWLRARLDPVRLIPALVQYSNTDFDPRSPQMLQSIRYLEYCVNEARCFDESIHNYLISLYARLGDSEKLESYLESQGTDLDSVCYDAKYALRMFSELKLLKASIHVYTVMGLFAEALELALNELGDVSLAEDIANIPEDDETKKKLWLMIAKHVISEKQDISHAMQFLKTCDLLKIEDILPFFPEFACIDHFKDAICESLEGYKGDIQNLRETMNQATEAADQIRQEIQLVRNRCFVVDRSHKCSSCGFALLNQAFYIFPCLHRFHASCLQNEALPYLKADLTVRSRLDRDSSESRNGDGSSRQSSQPNASSIDKETKAQLEEMIVAECLYCGELMADSVDKPFFSREEYEKTLRLWV